jgi:23S rRNA pseudouridine2605 synthase
MTDPKPEGDRIAKVLSRAGIASRREAERLIELGQVTVNGKIISSPALNVTAKDRITVAGQPVAEPEAARLWLYYKPEGLVTSASDEKGRETVFDSLPPELPRVMSVGRLDLNSEGLLLLTNDGELKRRLELPSTGWLRKYRVRIKGNPVDPDLDPLRKGITVEGERFQPMSVTLDRVQGANAWLTVGLREGKNREIRRAMTAIGLTVNRLIRISYGPFRLGDMEPGQVEEVRAKTLREQLGTSPDDAEKDGSRPAPKRTRAPRAKSASDGPVTGKPRAQKPPPTKQPSERTEPGGPARPSKSRSTGKPGKTPTRNSRPDGAPPRGPAGKKGPRSRG